MGSLLDSMTFLTLSHDFSNVTTTFTMRLRTFVGGHATLLMVSSVLQVDSVLMDLNTFMGSHDFPYDLYENYSSKRDSLPPLIQYSESATFSALPAFLNRHSQSS